MRVAFGIGMSFAARLPWLVPLGFYLALGCQHAELVPPAPTTRAAVRAAAPPAPSMPPVAERGAIVYEDGIATSRVDVAQTLPGDWLVVNLADEWSPYLFRDAVGHENEYHDTYVA